MSRSATQRPAGSFSHLLFDDSYVDSDGLNLLAAYRDAAESARQATAFSTAPAADASTSENDPAEGVRRGLPSVLRLRTVAGLAPELLGSLHGRLIAAGYLTAEIAGRADGLAYRITREGLRRLAGDIADADTEAA